MFVKRWLLGSAAVLLFSTVARAQWQNGDLALKTSGSLFQPGDRLQVELLALGPIIGPFAAQVRYRFVEDVQVVDRDGRERVRQRERIVTRPISATIERLDPYQRVVLDDAFHFGEGSPTACYGIEALVFYSSTGGDKPITTLRSCVCHRESRDVPADCSLYLRGLKQASGEDWLIFDGQFSRGGLFSVVLLSEGRVERHLPPGSTANAPDELQVFSNALKGTRGRALDILIHDHSGERSSTLARVPLPGTE